VQAPHEVCAQCHDTKDAKFASSHLGMDAKDVNCVSCHDPHASKDPKLFKSTVHAPFAARECAECHVVPAKKGK
jgi:predicted CXXCH cytochrome family protein